MLLGTQTAVGQALIQAVGNWTLVACPGAKSHTDFYIFPNSPDLLSASSPTFQDPGYQGDALKDLMILGDATAYFLFGRHPVEDKPKQYKHANYLLPSKSKRNKTSDRRRGTVLKIRKVFRMLPQV